MWPFADFWLTEIVLRRRLHAILLHQACSCGFNFIFKICIWKNIEYPIWFKKCTMHETDDSRGHSGLPSSSLPSSSLATFLTACLDGSQCDLFLTSVWPISHAFRQGPTLLDSAWFWVAWLGNKHKGIARLGTEFSGVCFRGSPSIPIPQNEAMGECVLVAYFPTTLW